MEKFIPYDKLSKKEKRKYDNEKRGDWGNTNPATKVIPNTYKERREKEKIKSHEDY